LAVIVASNVASGRGSLRCCVEESWHVCCCERRGSTCPGEASDTGRTQHATQVTLRTTQVPVQRCSIRLSRSTQSASFQVQLQHHVGYQSIFITPEGSTCRNTQ